MKNLLEWTLVFSMCILGGALLILWPLIAFLAWNPLWLIDISDWHWHLRLLFMLGVMTSAVAFYWIIRLGWK